MPKGRGSMILNVRRLVSDIRNITRFIEATSFMRLLLLVYETFNFDAISPCPTGAADAGEPGQTSCEVT
jgi:hypothetical protein